MATTTTIEWTRAEGFTGAGSQASRFCDEGQAWGAAKVRWFAGLVADLEKERHGLRDGDWRRFFLP